MAIKVKRVYEEPKKADGVRILVDRLWPRGLKKEEAKIDLWLKEIAPSNALRKWFNHDPEKWVEFQRKYAMELIDKKEHIDFLLKKADKATVTLLFSSKETEFNNAVALLNFFKKIIA